MTQEPCTGTNIDCVDAEMQALIVGFTSAVVVEPCSTPLAHPSLEHFSVEQVSDRHAVVSGDRNLGSE